ncbi:MAG TPA: HAD-IIIA family hydrolase [Candidatus Nanoarchaeia archaeon]|nr:HAD-IIIA family hydrolase [Candidatus Nanoarchaeia archaeon]
MRPVIVGCDRDGTIINEDDNIYLGKSPKWKEQLRILPGVASGIMAINEIPDSYLVVVTNQSGVAITGSEFAELTEGRVDEVNSEIGSLLRARGCRIDGFFVCPYVDNAYAAQARDRGRVIDEHYIRDGCRDLKPKPGLLEKAAAKVGFKLDQCSLYVMGDRFTDVEMGINGGGTGILIESPKTRELGDLRKTLRLKNQYTSRVHIANTFDAAARTIVELAAARTD